jgi:hypothetical protein
MAQILVPIPHIIIPLFSLFPAPHLSPQLVMPLCLSVKFISSECHVAFTLIWEAAEGDALMAKPKFQIQLKPKTLIID